MSHQANDYVKKLFRDRVTRRQKLLLWSLADYHNTSRRAAWPAIRTLAEESLMDIRECRRVLLELEEAGLIQRIKGGDGAGDFNEYRLIELDGKDGHMTPLQTRTQNSNKDGQKDGRKDGQKDGWKDGQNEHAIRKEREPEREQNQNPPNPLSSQKGGTHRLTVRQLAKLQDEIQWLESANGKDLQFVDPDPNCENCHGKGIRTYVTRGETFHPPCQCREKKTPVLSMDEIAQKAAATLLLPVDVVRNVLRDSGRVI